MLALNVSSGDPIHESFSRLLLNGLFLDRPSDVLPAEQGLFWEGEAASSVYRITDGVLRIFRHMVDGRRGVTGFLFPGDILGVSFRDRCLYSAEAVTDVRFRRLSRARFQRLVAQTPQLQEELLSEICDELSKIHDQVLMLSRKSAEERVASFLLLIANKTASTDQDNVEIDVPMSRVDISDYLGLTVETVCRAMTKLRQQKYITPAGRRKVVLRRPSDLMLFAGDREMM
jgi:CRP/FNR family transcriptional regulator, anaerobic regulatory protein